MTSEEYDRLRLALTGKDVEIRPIIYEIEKIKSGGRSLDAYWRLALHLLCLNPNLEKDDISRLAEFDQLRLLAHHPTVFGLQMEDLSTLAQGHVVKKATQNEREGSRRLSFDRVSDLVECFRGTGSASKEELEVALAVLHGRSSFHPQSKKAYEVLLDRYSEIVPEHYLDEAREGMARALFDEAMSENHVERHMVKAAMTRPDIVTEGLRKAILGDDGRRKVARFLQFVEEEDLSDRYVADNMSDLFCSVWTYYCFDKSSIEMFLRHRPQEKIIFDLTIGSIHPDHVETALGIVREKAIAEIERREAEIKRREAEIKRRQASSAEGDDGKSHP